jgi:hypothetical protein
MLSAEDDRNETQPILPHMNTREILQRLMDEDEKASALCRIVIDHYRDERGVAWHELEAASEALSRARFRLAFDAEYLDEQYAVMMEDLRQWRKRFWKRQRER